MTTTPVPPRSSTLAASLLAGQAVLVLAGLAVSLPYRDALGADNLDADALAAQLSGGTANLSAAGVGFAVALAATFLALAVFVWRGSDPARIAAYALSGGYVLAFLVGGTFGAPSPAKAVPDWYLTYSAAASLLALVMSAAVVVLLIRRQRGAGAASRLSLSTMD